MSEAFFISILLWVEIILGGFLLVRAFS